jgi:shikimate kinase
MQASIQPTNPPITTIQTPIVLLGIKHCGKTTLGRHLAHRINLPFVDTDQVILEQQGRTAREVMVTGGKEALLTAEAAACATVAAQGSAVIATGGGICDNSAALDALSGGIFVFIDVAEKTLCDRILCDSPLPAYIAQKHPANDDDVRRIFHPLYEERRRLYLDIAALVFVPEDLPPEENAQTMLLAISRPIG